MRFLIDDSTLTLKNLFQWYDSLLPEKESHTFYVDEKVMAFKTEKNLDAQALAVVHHLYLMDKEFELIPINAAQLEDTALVKDILNSMNDDWMILTQNKSKAYALKSILTNDEAQVVNYLNGQIVPWVIEAGKRPAFYIENDRYISETVKNQIPEELDYVYSPKYGYLKIGKKLYFGGEGDVFGTYNKLLFKRFKTKYLTYQNFKKLSSMLEITITNEQIVWPKDIVYYEGIFVGYVMDEVSDAMSMDDLRDIGFGPYTPIDRIQIALTFMQNVHYLHQKNILVGDMKFDNILVKSPSEVYIIDSGSFQVDDYPCVVFNYEFSDQEYTEKDLKETLRDVDAEYYPINKIVFETLVMKSPYYSPDRIEIGAQEDRQFMYSIDLNQSPDSISNHLKFWFSLPSEIRLYFHQYFSDRRVTYLQDLIPAFQRFITQINPKGAHTQ